MAIDRLQEMRLAAVEQRIKAELALGLHVELIPELGELVRAQPLREELSAHLMLALYRSGLDDQDWVAREALAVNARCRALETHARSAVFTSANPPEDIARLVAAHDVDLVLLDSAVDSQGRLPDDVAAIVERSASDVAVLVGSAPDVQAGGGVFVPFGGSPHDWSALELAGWLAVAMSSPLRLVGTKADPRRGRRDASRLLADAALAVQRVTGVETEPVLAEHSEEGLMAAVEPGAIVVLGISEQWRREGIAASRRTLLRRAGPPVLLVYGGPRPGRTGSPGEPHPVHVDARRSKHERRGLAAT